MGNVCGNKIGTESYNFYWKQIALSNSLIASIQLRLADKTTYVAKNQTKHNIEYCTLLSNFCEDLQKTIDECAFNKELLYGVNLKLWRIRKFSDLVYSYKVQFDKINAPFLNESETKCMEQILLCTE